MEALCLALSESYLPVLTLTKILNAVSCPRCTQWVYTRYIYLGQTWDLVYASWGWEGGTPSKVSYCF